MPWWLHGASHFQLPRGLASTKPNQPTGNTTFCVETQRHRSASPPSGNRWATPAAARGASPHDHEEDSLLLREESQRAAPTTAKPPPRLLPAGSPQLAALWPGNGGRFVSDCQRQRSGGGNPGVYSSPCPTVPMELSSPALLPPGCGTDRHEEMRVQSLQATYDSVQINSPLLWLLGTQH